MENDAPVVGPDAPTANSKMVKLDIATADRSRPSGLRVKREQSVKHVDSRVRNSDKPAGEMEVRTDQEE